jgi:putative transposase
VPARDPDPLETFKKEIERRKRGRRRTNRVALFPDRYEEEVLFDIGLACARPWNELNYEKRHSFFNQELSPEKRDEINKKYYHRYKEVLGVNAGQVINKNDETWNVFFELLDLETRKIITHIKKVSPPGYWMDRDTGEKRIHILIRNDRYHVESISKKEGYIVLEDFDLKIKYVGRIRWEGEQGRLEIIYEAGRWQAYIPIEVGVDPARSNKKGYVKPIHVEEEKKRRIINPKSIKQRDPSVIRRYSWI